MLDLLQGDEPVLEGWDLVRRYEELLLEATEKIGNGPLELDRRHRLVLVRLARVMRRFLLRAFEVPGALVSFQALTTGHGWRFSSPGTFHRSPPGLVYHWAGDEVFRFTQSLMHQSRHLRRFTQDVRFVPAFSVETDEKLHLARDGLASVFLRQSLAKV